MNFVAAKQGNALLRFPYLLFAPAWRKASTGENVVWDRGFQHRLTLTDRETHKLPPPRKSSPVLLFHLATECWTRCSKDALFSVCVYVYTFLFLHGHTWWGYEQVRWEGCGKSEGFDRRVWPSWRGDWGARHVVILKVAWTFAPLILQLHVFTFEFIFLNSRNVLATEVKMDRHANMITGDKSRVLPEKLIA